MTRCPFAHSPRLRQFPQRRRSFTPWRAPMYSWAMRAPPRISLPIHMSTILAIESTCDETGAAVVVDGWDVRSNVVASQVELHARYRGVVPEIASRAHIENILPVIKQSLDS